MPLCRIGVMFGHGLTADFCTGYIQTPTSYIITVHHGPYGAPRTSYFERLLSAPEIKIGQSSCGLLPAQLSRTPRSAWGVAVVRICTVNGPESLESVATMILHRKI